jgi:glycosyltransferase involved in cell wall biosynthesis
LAPSRINGFIKKKLRILHIGIKYWPYENEVIHHNDLLGKRGGGMTKYCSLLINAFPEEVETVLMVQKLKNQSSYERYNNVEIYRVSTFGNRSIRQIVANTRSLFTGMRIIRKGKIDVVHGHLSAGIAIAWFLGKIFRIPVVATPYSFVTVGFSHLQSRIMRFIENVIYRKADKLVFESEENRVKAYTIRGLSYPNSVVINTGIIIPEARNSHGNDKNMINLLYIGRLIKIKCIENLILAFLFMDAETKKKIHLDILGEGALYEELNALIINHDLTENITLHGYVEDSVGFFLKANIFLLTSHQEGLSISLLEAMSYGLACIVNNFGVPFDETQVVILQNNNPETIATAVTRLVSDPDLITFYGKNARKVLSEKFTVNHFARSYQDLYSEVIKNRSKH